MPDKLNEKSGILAPPRNKTLYTISTFARTSIRRYFRDPVALFFTVAFPLIFLFVFGSFSKGNNISFHIALINQSKNPYANQFTTELSKDKTFNIRSDVSSLDQAKDKMSRSEIDAAVILPPNFGELKAGAPSGNAQIYYDQNNEASAQALISIMRGLFENINAKLVKVHPPLSVSAKPINEKGLSRFDYTFAGLIGFSIMGLGVFGPVNYFPRMKEQGILRRLHVTPIKVWQYFLANVISNAVIGIFAIAVMFVVAITVFHFKMAGNYLELVVMIVLGILSIFGIGLAVGGWAKNENQAAPLANIIVFPMLFLSGTFFPRFEMPLWLQHVTTFLPLTPIIDGIRMIATEGKHLVDIGPQLGLIAVWTIIIYLIAFRVFRWE
jgi:ABC-2 type transport system permease protein